MSIQLKDVIHLYLGCEVIGTYNDEIGSKGYLTGITNGGEDCEIQFFEQDDINLSEQPEYNSISGVNLVLRPLSDMTEKEMLSVIETGKLMYLGGRVNRFITGWTAYSSENFIYLLKQGFDLFGLIESGQAIKKETE